MQLPNRHIDYFKVFKLLELKKIQKQGDVKLVQDKTLSTKVLCIEGAVSTQNYILFDSSEALKSHPTLCFSQRFLYLVSWAEVSKVFSFQLVLTLNGKVCKTLYSTAHKSQQMNSQGILLIPLSLKTAKWLILVIDLHDLCRKHLNIHQVRLNFELAAVQVRAHSRLKNIYLSDDLFYPTRLPKEIQLPLKPGEDFYFKYDYILLSPPESTRPEKEPILPQPSEEPNDLKQDKEGPGNRAALLGGKLTKNKQIVKKTQQIGVGKSVGLKKMEEASEEMPLVSKAPKPLVTLDMSICAMEGHSLCVDGFMSLGAFVTHPLVFAVHDSIKCMSLHMSSLYKLAVGYANGSICVWDIVRQRPLAYLKTDLIEVKQIIAKGEEDEERIFLLGLDRMRRQTILIINSQQVLFRQISNYSIHELILCSLENRQLIVSYGFENIRLWKMNDTNHIITGVGLYLGKLNRKVLYTSACQIGYGALLVTDNSGYLTKVSLASEKVESMQKVSENGLDRIVDVPELNGVMVAETSGTLKLLSYDLQVLEQYELGNRIKTICYKKEQGKPKLFLSHYNCSTAVLNLDDSSYRYESRQHSSRVVGLGYNSALSKLVSVSQDNTMRIWALSASNSNRNSLQYQVKQQYQFLINSGEGMTTLGLDGSVYAYVGFEGGMVRKINIQKYQVENEKSFAFGPADQQSRLKINSIKVSKNSQSLVICVQEIDGAGYVVLSDPQLNIVYKYNPPSLSPSKCLESLAGFNQTHKKMYICWSCEGSSRVQIYSLSGPPGQPCSQFYLQSTPLSIRHSGQVLYVDTCIGIYQVYKEEGEMMAAINIGKNEGHQIYGSLVVSCEQEQLSLQVLPTGLKKCIDIPEAVSNIIIFPFDQQEANHLRGLIFCSGDSSNALYAADFEARNVQLQISMQVMGDKLAVDSDGQEELECVESKLLLFNHNTQAFKNGHPTTCLAHFQAEPEIPGQDQLQVVENSNPKHVQPQSTQPIADPDNCGVQQPVLKGPSQAGLQLIYGWSYSYCSPTQECKRLIWHPSTQSTVFLNHRTLILHYFKQPVEQRFVRLPVQPSLLLPVGSKYIGVALGNQLRLYTGALVYLRCFSVLGQTITSATLSNCEGFLIVISSSSKTDTTYIQVMDFLTVSTLCSTYKRSSKDPARVECNPYQQRLEFVVYTQSQASFYRVTSILTLQMQELEEMQHLLSSTELGGILCAKYLNLSQEEIILLGMYDGSILVVDSRANSILMVCRKVCNCSIRDILFQLSNHSNNQTGSLTLALVTGSNNVLVYKLQCATLNSLISCLDKPSEIKLTTDSEITLYSDLKTLSGGSLGMIAMTKFGVLWLLDLTDYQTIKVLSVHGWSGQAEDQVHGPRITKGVLMEGNKEPTFITGSEDGSVKETLLRNLEQVNQIYRPRRCVCDILVANNMLIVAFDMELYFYTLPKSSSQNIARSCWKFSGSINLMEMHMSVDQSVKSHSYSYKQRDLKIVSIKNVPFSDNYVVCTKQKLIMLHHQKMLSEQTGKLKLGIKQISGGFWHARGLDLQGRDYILVVEPSKITVWVRKEKRGENILEQLGQVDDLVYYVVDIYQVEASCARFAPFVSRNSKQYIVSLSKKPILQWRDYEQHSIIREIEIGATGCTTFQVSREGNLLVGDEEGALWQIKENGLTLNKIRLCDGAIVGIQELGDGRIMAYGPCLAITNI